MDMGFESADSGFLVWRRACVNRLAFGIIFLFVFQSPLFSQNLPLRISSVPAQQVTPGKSFRVQLTAAGGTEPYQWQFGAAQVPAGLSIDSNSGLVSGAMKTPGEYRIAVTVKDSSNPTQQATATLVITVVPYLTVRWLQKPQIANGGISGSVEVENNSGNTLQMTVIVLAVNTIGKAFALGYQHFDLSNATGSPRIPFSSALPYGSYVIHVDAVGEDPADSRIYRSRLQTSRLTLQQP